MQIQKFQKPPEFITAGSASDIVAPKLWRDTPRSDAANFAQAQQRTMLTTVKRLGAPMYMWRTAVT